MKQPTVIEITFASRKEAAEVYKEVEKLLTQRGVGTSTLAMHPVPVEISPQRVLELFKGSRAKPSPDRPNEGREQNGDFPKAHGGSGFGFG